MDTTFPEILSEEHKAILTARRAYRAAMRDGIEVAGIRLAARDRDRAMFAQMLVLLREAEAALPDEEARTAFLASPQVIADVQGKVHSLPVSELRGLLISYGLAYQALWAANRTPMPQPPDDPPVD